MLRDIHKLLKWLWQDRSIVIVPVFYRTFAVSDVHSNVQWFCPTSDVNFDGLQLALGQHHCNTSQCGCFMLYLAIYSLMYLLLVCRAEVSACGFRVSWSDSWTIADIHTVTGAKSKWHRTKPDGAALTFTVLHQSNHLASITGKGAGRFRVSRMIKDPHG